MKKIKDLIYNFNDIFIAILILALAVAIVAWRVDDIMAYPEYVASKEQQQTASQGNVDFSDVDLSEQPTENINPNPEDVSSEEPPVDTGNDQQGQQGQQQGQQQQPPVGDTKITIPSGSSGSKIADILAKAGVVPTAQDFLNEVKNQGVETKLKAGTFTIPGGATVEEIVKILTR
jgi:hypothetical protein